MANRDGDVNYSSFSSEELRQAYDAIDPIMYPLNFKNLFAEMTVRAMFANDSPDEISRSSGVGPITRPRFIFALFLLASMLCYFFYGVARFPDAPIEPCGTNQYCGKQGQPHTLDEFEL